ncbi:MAG: hypothetical protein ACK55Z_16425, partial [bacterium]
MVVEVIEVIHGRSTAQPLHVDLALLTLLVVIVARLGIELLVVLGDVAHGLVITHSMRGGRWQRFDVPMSALARKLPERAKQLLARLLGRL